MSVHDNNTRLCIDSLLGRVIDRDEAHDIGEFQKKVYRNARFEDMNVNIIARGDSLVFRVHQGVTPFRYVEVTIPKDSDMPVEFRTTEDAVLYANREIIE